VDFKAVPASFASPYPGGQAVGGAPAEADAISFTGRGTRGEADAGAEASVDDAAPKPQAGQQDLVQAAQRYADLCRDLAGGAEFDVIHAHDWITFPAAMAVAEQTGKPMIAHVHSTEYDRAGEHMDQRIAEVEQQGLEQADRVVAVSYFTHSVLQKRYNIDPEKVVVVHNGLDHHASPGQAAANPPSPPQRDEDEKTVLFLGRMTHQKGPEYFVEAAKKVLTQQQNVKFLMAGAGELMEQVVELAAREGIGNRVLFTGFLYGGEVERAYRIADLFVMPSVSEPFGLATLEAMSYDVPVIVSRTSGVSEVINHALKVDFWNTDELAEKILSVLNHPELGKTMTQQAGEEVKKLTWDQAAKRCQHVYHELIAQPH
jgi:glycosyltransferase involved in cell wall biosynthesis